ncbi:sulfotransferase family protein [Lutibacter oceani]|uniref:Sulfotransferase family protein n=1 Tax=Lutibacter oceani TaxID=1853311 RepID=A0A3D9RKF3_9FLAO|nr:sulfotransferase family 2 domain-containing protein [Lutibacter oceani]REE80353.1 sulfotransferase family protein [Lutibacter oceani]
MIISHTLKIIFIHVQRTGGSTIINLLKNQLGNNIEILSQHGNARTSETYLLEEYKDYYTFGFTRNPWERILSWYSLIHKNDKKSLAQERKRFEIFIESDYASDFTTQQFHYNTLDYFSNKKGILKVDEILRYENFENEILKLFNKLNLPLTEIPITNNTNLKIFQDFYTKKSKNLIAEKCKKDIEYFNYVF